LLSGGGFGVRGPILVRMWIFLYYFAAKLRKKLTFSKDEAIYSSEGIDEIWYSQQKKVYLL
jgi:hypothetical protein